MFQNSDYCVTVVIVNWYSSELISELISNLDKKAYVPNSISYLIIDNTNGSDDKLRKLRFQISNIRIKINDGIGLQRSVAHALGLNRAMVFLDTPYTLVVDPDVHVFQDEWERVCIQRLRDHNIVAIGAPYPSWKLGKIHNFPSPVFMFIKTEDLLRVDTDWYPFPPKTRRIYNFFIRKVLRLGIVCSKDRLDKYEKLRLFSSWFEEKIGVCSPDTGWLIVNRIKELNKESIQFDAVYSSDPRVVAHSKSKILQELSNNYELYLYDKEPFLTHKYTSDVFHWKTRKGMDKTYWQECISAFEKP